MEGFDLFKKWMVKHHPDLDLSGLVIGDVEKELMSNRPSVATTVEVTEEAVTITPVDPPRQTVTYMFFLSNFSSFLLFCVR